MTTPVSARAVGMGGAFTAVSDDVTAVHFNPAGLALIKHHQVSSMYLKGLADIQTEFLGYAQPLPPQFSPSENGVSAFGASVLLSQLGKIDVLQTDTAGNYVNEQTINAGSDRLFSLSYAAMIGRDSLSVFGSEEHYLGVTGRYLSTTLAQDYSAKTVALDAGYMNLWKAHGIRWGLLAQNIGPKIRFREHADRLPATYRLGCAWQRDLPIISAKPLALALDGILDVESKKSIHVGAEYWLNGLAAVRGGYQRGQQKTTDWTAGFGAKIPFIFKERAQQILIDYGILLMGDLGNTHRVSLTLEFDPPGFGD